ncbi:CD225/dispanin family protein [Staphylococcus chromogenes]|nr:CD225/dispanin family protein [Staphylococcus chromogenes]
MTTPQNPFDQNNSGADANNAYGQGNSTPYGGADNTYGQAGASSDNNPYGAAGAFPGGATSGYGDMGEKPSNNMVLAIIAGVLTLCTCCLPFGLLSLIPALKVDKLWAAGDAQGAREASAKAKQWSLIFIAVAIGLMILGVVLQLTGVIANPYLNGDI